MLPESITYHGPSYHDHDHSILDHDDVYASQPMRRGKLGSRLVALMEDCVGDFDYLDIASEVAA